MTRFTLHIPEQYNDGELVAPEYFAAVEQAVEDIAGGWTLTHAIGGWRGKDSRYRESVRLYHADIDGSVEHHIDRLSALAQDIASALNQEAVYLTAQAITRTFVYSRQEVQA